MKQFYNKKKILITGHTGFKGTWLTSCLLEFNSEIMGISLLDEKIKYYKKNCHYQKVKNVFFDITNYNKLKLEILKFKPQIIFHLAAQSLVSESYKDPYRTIQTNVIGTLNVIDIARNIKSLKSLIIITSDKCYLNKEIKRGYKETDELGGDDPYSASKASAENIFNAYAKSFFYSQNIFGFATTRAGNVIGGGDWSKNRLIPDCIRSLQNKKKLEIRNPFSTRPWQHVLEPLSGYLILAKKIYQNKNKKLYSGSWNFGPLPKETMQVRKVVKYLFKYIKFNKKIIRRSGSFKETVLLKLNSNKSIKLLKWTNKWNMKKSIKETAKWYKEFLNKKNVKKVMTNQIKEYFELNDKND
jgi:CDP-glucose 4,6-dehydratase